MSEHDHYSGSCPTCGQRCACPAPSPSAAHAGLLAAVNDAMCGLPSDKGIVTVLECALYVGRFSHGDEANLRRLISARLSRLAARIRAASGVKDSLTTAAHADDVAGAVARWEAALVSESHPSGPATAGDVRIILAALRAASPSPGAVEAAIIEAAWEVDLAVTSDAPQDTLDAAHAQLREALLRLPVQHSAARRGAAG